MAQELETQHTIDPSVSRLVGQFRTKSGGDFHVYMCSESLTNNCRDKAEITVPWSTIPKLSSPRFELLCEFSILCPLPPHYST